MFEERLMQYIRTMPSVAALGGRPDRSKYGLGDDVLCAGLNLLVGGHVTPAAGAWETLDPYAPGSVTYQQGLEDKELAARLRGRFSVIVVHAVLEHVNPILYSACITNLHVMLKPGGVVSVEVPWLWAYHTQSEKENYDFGGDFCRLSADGLRRMFEEHPACKWKTLVCQYAIPPDSPDGVGVCAIFRKDSES